MNLEIIKQNYSILAIGCICLLLILYSWTLPIIVVSVMDKERSNNSTIANNLRQFIANYFRRKGGPSTDVHGNSNNVGRKGFDMVDSRIADEELFDPLLHNNMPSMSTKEQSTSTATKQTETIKRSPLSISNPNNDIEESTAETTSKTKIHLVNRAESDLKIDKVLDKHLAQFFQVVFHCYVSPEWAPYETRQHLKQSLRKLLIVFTERILITFFECDPRDSTTKNYTNAKLVNFCKQKIIPIVLYHLESTSASSSPSSESQQSFSSINTNRYQLSPIQLKRLKLKVRRLCKQLLLEFMTLEQQQCRLWIELCVSILADGVIWNCILLGRDELPKIIEEALEHLLLNIATKNSSSSSDTTFSTNNIRNSSQNMNQSHDSRDREPQCDKVPGENTSTSNVPEQHINNIPNETELDNTNQIKPEIREKVPMLLDSFLDPSHDLEQPLSIVSRWRPTLNEILIERDLLYSLIQYLRGERALEYLQAVLDESPDGSAYCRKILELEYLPNFCRSKLFLESLGMSRTEVGVEAGTSEALLKSRGSSKLKKSGSGKHARSTSSGGGVSSGIFKSGIVDGLAIPPSSMPANASLSSSGASSTSLSTTAGPSESDSSSFRKRQHVLQPFIKKFYDSVTTFGKPGDSSKEKERARRLGIDTKDYEDMNHPDVLSTISVQPCDVLTCSTEIAASWVNRAPWLESVIIGWVQLFHPFLKPKFDRFVDEKLDEHLTLDNFIQFIDFVKHAFVASQATSIDSNDDDFLSFSRNDNSSNSKLPSNSSSAPMFSSTLVQNIINWMILNLFDYTQIVTTIHSNKDEFIVLFVDILDLLVNELTKSAIS